MILPTNGRVIIIDDEPSQAVPLISVLSKYNIPSSYFDARKDSLPEHKLSDTRVLFLDINLNGGQQPNWEAEKGMLINNIEGILKPNTPYILFVWSVNETEHFVDLENLFNKELAAYKPIIPLIRMEKNSLFQQDVDGDKIVWSLKHSKEDTINIIKNKIDEGVAAIDSLEALLKWENIVNDASALVANEILALANYSGNTAEGLKQVYLGLAHAYWGKTLYGQSGDIITSKSLVTLTHLLADKLELKINNDLKITLLKTFPKQLDYTGGFRAELNKRLLMSDDVVNSPLPGNVYISERNDLRETIVNDLVDRKTFDNDFCKEVNIGLATLYIGLEINEEYLKPFQKFGFKKAKEVVEHARYIEIELTPICDYSQKNQKLCRLVSGVILDAQYQSNRKKNADYFYMSPIFILDGQAVNFYCDFRFVRSADPKELDGLSPKFRLRHLFQTEIQSHLARQVSRPGLVSL